MQVSAVMTIGFTPLLLVITLFLFNRGLAAVFLFNLKSYSIATDLKYNI